MYESLVVGAADCGRSCIAALRLLRSSNSIHANLEVRKKSGVTRNPGTDENIENFDTVGHVPPGIIL